MIKIQQDKELVELGHNLMINRIKVGFSRKHVAAVLLIKRRTLISYELGDRCISTVMAAKMAKLYHIPLTSLLNYYGTQNYIRRADSMLLRPGTIRKFLGITQQEAADAVGISRATLSNYEHNRSNMPVTTFIKLCELYKLSAEEINVIADYLASRPMTISNNSN